MPKVRVAARAQHLGARHAQALVDLGRDRVLADRLGERRPAAARIELGGRTEQRLAAARAVISARRVALVVFAAERALGGLHPGDTEALGRELLHPLGFGLDHLLGRGLHFAHDNFRSFSAGSATD